MNMDHKRKYAIAKHHAWAGSVLLAILLALRVFIEVSEQKINNLFFIIIGSLLVLYILIALIFTYKHRVGLIDQSSIQPSTSQSSSDEEKTPTKEQLKIEKKKAKAAVKKAKKQEK